MANSRILVVDDDQQMLSAIVEQLEAAGYGVDSAENGKAGLELALASDYDMVVTDLDMPIMDGIEFIQRLKAKKPNQPISIISAKIDTFTRTILSLGIDGALSKPYQLAELYQMVSERKAS